MYNCAEVKSMKPKITKIKSRLNVRATAEAQAKIQKDLAIDDPTDEEARMIIEKAIAEGLDNEKSEQKTSQKRRTSDSRNSESEKE